MKKKKYLRPQGRKNKVGGRRKKEGWVGRNKEKGKGRQ